MDIDWGQHEMIDPYLIVVDHKYQRVEKPHLIQKIGANFDPVLFGRPLCFMRGNDVHYCVDGQQRIAAVKSLTSPHRLIPVVSFAIVGLQREAEVFVLINETRKALGGLEKHRGKIIAQDAAAVQIEQAVAKAGYSVAVNHNSPRAIASIASLGYAHGLIAEDGIVQLLVAAREAWGDDKQAVDGRIIRALADIIDGQSKNGGYRRAKLVTALKKTTPAQLFRKSEEIHFKQGTTKMESLRRAFIALAGV